MKAKVVYVAAALALVFSMAAALIPAGPANAAIFNIADGDVTGLINAINTANTNAVPDTINLAINGTYTLNISDNDTDGPNGLPSINSSITINGNGATIERSSAGGTPNLRIFHVAATGNVSMFSMTIRNGNVTEDDKDGGGLYNHSGIVMMTNCTVSGNKAGYFGGGLYNEEGTVTMTNCTVSGNTAGSGGGLYNHSGNVTMASCTVSGNTAVYGGGIGNYVGNVTLTNCTVSGNTAAYGGGISNNEGNVTMTNCTVSGNEATDDGGGIYNTASTTTLTCAIVYGNTPDDIYGGYTDAGENIVGDPDGDPDPFLDPLQNNGGPTETHALLAGSPAIDGCVTGCTVDTDQRGVSRPQLTACDVGAYEYQQQSTLPVGGTVEPVDRIGILTPWLVLAVLIAVAVTIAVVVRRRMA
jgi:hypothetical protein